MGICNSQEKNEKNEINDKIVELETQNKEQLYVIEKKNEELNKYYLENNEKQKLHDKNTMIKYRLNENSKYRLCLVGIWSSCGLYCIGNDYIDKINMTYMFEEHGSDSITRHSYKHNVVNKYNYAVCNLEYDMKQCENMCNYAIKMYDRNVNEVISDEYKEFKKKYKDTPFNIKDQLFIISNEMLNDLEFLQLIYFNDEFKESMKYVNHIFRKTASIIRVYEDLYVIKEKILDLFDKDMHKDIIRVIITYLMLIFSRYYITLHFEKKLWYMDDVGYLPICAINQFNFSYNLEKDIEFRNK